MEELQNIPIPQITEYKGKRVLTTLQLAECYGTDSKAISYNFNHNKDKYKDRIHYLCLKGEALRAFREIHELPSNLNKLYLWSERGVLLHAKSLNTERAWAVYEKLVDFYFHSRQQLIDGESFEDGKVLASELYSYLGLSKRNYWSWVERNITKNRFAVENLDYRYIGNNDFILSRTLIKSVCMMSKTDEGEQCRQEYIQRLNEYDAVLSALGIQRKENLSLGELTESRRNPLARLDFSKCKLTREPVGIAEKRLLSINEFSAYCGLGKTKARKYAEDNDLIVRIGRRVLIDRTKLERILDDRENEQGKAGV